MRAYHGTHFEGEFHLVKRPLQVRRRNGANDSAAFVALDIRLIAADDAEQAAATIRRSEIRMREHWAGFRLLFVAVDDSRISRRAPVTMLPLLSPWPRPSDHNRGTMTAGRWTHFYARTKTP